MPSHATPPAYIDDALYPATYLRELSPAWLRYAATVNGACPRPIDERFRYLELGCGQALSAVVHAAAFPGAEFHACDAHAGCIAAARRLCVELELENLTLHQASFAALTGGSLGRFDFVAAHGVYSWVDGRVRNDLRQLMSESLTTQGVAYLSYNCMPGWAAELPLRRLIVELAHAQAGDHAAKARAAVAQLDALTAGSSGLHLHPELAAAVAAYVGSPAAYLAHEFLNPVFEPFYSVDVAEEMAAAGLVLVGSATLADNHPALLVPEQTAETIAALATSRQRQLAMDLTVHRRFRRDLFVRADHPGGTAERGLGPLLVGCVGDPHTLATDVRVPRGRLHFDDGFVAALRRLMRRGSASVGALVHGLGAGDRNAAAIVRNVLYLVAGGAMVPFARSCPEPRSAGGSLQFASAAAARAMARAAACPAGGWIPSPVAGTGLALDAAAAAAVIDHVQRGRRMPRGDDGDLACLVRLGILV